MPLPTISRRRFLGGAAASAALATLLRRAEALTPREVVEINWSAEPWNRGCPVAVLGPGTLTEFGDVLRRPVGRIHFAGTETSTYWNGYMDGAVRSGERAAAEVLALLE